MESTRQGQHFKTRSRLFLDKPRFLIRLFIHTLLRNGVHLVKKIRNIVSANQFKEITLSFIRLKENSVFAIHNTKGLKLLTGLRLNFSHLNVHKFRHTFKDTVDPMCKCGLETETTLHFLLRCRVYSTIRTELLDDIYAVASSLMNYPDEKLLNILLYGSEYFIVKTNQSILKSTTKF